MPGLLTGRSRLVSLARVLRLDELSRGLMKEEARVRECEDPLLYVERRAYLTALRQALSGVEGARVALAKALQRIDEPAELPPEGAAG